MSAAHFVPATVPHGFIRQRRNQSAMDEPPRVRMRRRQPEPQHDRLGSLLRVDRLPGIGERATAGLALKTFGNIGGVHGIKLEHWRYFAIERDRCANCTVYKVLNESAR